MPVFQSYLYNVLPSMLLQTDAALVCHEDLSGVKSTLETAYLPTRELVPLLGPQTDPMLR